jgi:nitrous oxidase accessory protein NosD
MVVKNATADVSFTTFENNLEGPVGIHHAGMYFADVTITGRSATQGTGFLLADYSLGSLHRTSIAHTRTAVGLHHSESYSFGGNSITSNTVGVSVMFNSYFELIGGTTISNNSDTGLVMDANSTAILGDLDIHRNGTGVSIAGNSYAILISCNFVGNATGVKLDLFGKGSLSDCTFDDNDYDYITERDGKYYVN